MSRKGQIRVREVPADPKYHDRTVAKFMNVVMERGKKSLAEQIFYGALDLVAERSKEDGLVVFKRALDNVRPAVEVRSRRVGGANYQVPGEVRPVRRNSLGDALAGDGGARARREVDGRAAGRGNPRGGGQSRRRRSRSAKTPIEWRMPTRRSPTTAGNTEFFRWLVRHQ